MLFFSASAAAFLFFNSPLCKAQDLASPKNVIIMIADGSGFNHFQAASLYQHGKPDQLTCQQFPVKMAMSTFPHESRGGHYDPQLAWEDFSYVLTSLSTDSAASATAMSTGEKTENGAIGVGIDGAHLKNLMERAEDVGKATGIVTSVSFSHSTPAGFSIHNASRNNYEKIAQEMLLNSRLDVIMGCGHPFFHNDGSRKYSSQNYTYVGGEALWKDLLDPSQKVGNDADGDGVNDPWILIESLLDFRSMAQGETPKRLLGIPRVNTTLQQGRKGDSHAAPYVVAMNQNIPTLAEMAAAALNILSKDPQGFVLMIEGGAADWASHQHQSGRMVEEELDFHAAVDIVHQWIEQNSSWNETLLIITADHETGYLTGPGSGAKNEKPLWNELITNGAGTIPEMQWNTSEHSNSLVPFFAKGAGCQLYLQNIKGKDPVRGPYIDNTDIPKVIFWERHAPILP
ncbi:MAG TPA: alkaline phosphatase [Candidatus Omnitrophota bacterium]|nr:alkaline phosphatase [Candidatus Omnitrophota bacterium]